MSSTIQQQFIQACLGNNLNLVKELIKNNPGSKFVDYVEQTPTLEKYGDPLDLVICRNEFYDLYNFLCVNNLI